jgi:hypothetical protein
MRANQAATGTAGALEESEKKKEVSKFAGGGKTLGTGGSSGAEEKPWVKAARERHERYAKKKKEEEMVAAAEEERVRKETEKKCRAIAEAAAAAMSEEEKREIARKEELESKRMAIESQIEDKLLRDAELKRKKEEKREKMRRAKEDNDAAMDQQVEDLEALALAHAVQQSVESQVSRRSSNDVEDAMLNAALMESAKSESVSSPTGSRSKFSDMLSSASDEVRAERNPRPPNRSKTRKMTPPGAAKRSGGLLKQYEKQLGFLREMGFENVIEASTALEASGGDVQRAVELLTSTFIIVVLLLFYS